MATITHNPTVDTIKGDKLFLFVDIAGVKTPIAFGTSCGLDLSGDTIEVTSKMSGKWKEYLAGQLGYTINCDSLLSKTNGEVSFQTLKKLMETQTPITFAMGLSAPDANIDFAQDASGIYETGSAIITSLNMKADNGAICTSSVSLQGTGALADGNIGDGVAGLVVAPTTLSFTAAADAVGKTITATSTGNLTFAAAPSGEEWLTVTKAGKVATVKVLANTNSEPRTALVTIKADGKTVTVPVTQAGA